MRYPPLTSVAASRAKLAGLQDIAMTVATAEAASASAWRAAPARGGSKTAAA
jgi:hypothetical protein